MGDWVFGCDVCQEVCPWNRARASAHHPELSAAAGVGESLDLIELLATDEAAFRNRFRGTPLTRPKRGGLLRNAAVALGNSGGRAAIPALTAALDDADPLVRGHAAWALSRIGDLPSETVQSLERARAIEEDQEVRWELEDALSLLAKRSV
jgi:epoxyqueuosine reductase